MSQTTQQLFRRILVPHDFSDHATRASSWSASHRLGALMSNTKTVPGGTGSGSSMQAPPTPKLTITPSRRQSSARTCVLSRTLRRPYARKWSRGWLGVEGKRRSLT